MPDSSVSTKMVPGSALFTSVFKSVWINLNMKNCRHHSVSYTSGMSPKICFSPTVEKVGSARQLGPSIQMHLIAVDIIIAWLSISILNIVQWLWSFLSLAYMVLLNPEGSTCLIFCFHSQQVSRLHIARILVSFGTWRASVLPSLESSAKSHWLTYFVLVPHKPPDIMKELPPFTTSAPYCVKEKPGELDIVPAGVWDFEGEVVRWMCSAFDDCGWVQGHIRHKESFGKTHMGVISTALEIPSAACSSAGYSTEAVHSKTLLLIATSCQGLLVRQREVLFTLAQPGLTTLSSWHPFSFQPSQDDSWGSMKSKRMYLIEIFCRMKLCKACFIFFFGKSSFFSS